MHLIDNLQPGECHLAGSIRLINTIPSPTYTISTGLALEIPRSCTYQAVPASSVLSSGPKRLSRVDRLPSYLGDNWARQI